MRRDFLVMRLTVAHIKSVMRVMQNLEYRKLKKSREAIEGPWPIVNQENHESTILIWRRWGGGGTIGAPILFALGPMFRWLISRPDHA